VVEIILDGREVTVQDVLRHQRWRPTTRSARHKLAKFVKDHEHLLALDPTSPEGACLSNPPGWSPGALPAACPVTQPPWAGSTTSGDGGTLLQSENRCSHPAPASFPQPDPCRAQAA
jgi:hypothetical protein